MFEFNDIQNGVLDIVKIGLPLSVVASMFAQGLSIDPSQLVLLRKRTLLMLWSLVVVLFLVPVAALGIIRLLDPSPAVAIGLAILVASPAAPMMLVKVPKTGGSLAYLASLHLSLALLAPLSVPITLYLLSKVLGFQIEVGVLAVARVVGVTILVPVCLGMVVRSFFPRVADTIAPALTRVGGVMLLILGLCLVAMTYDLLLKMDLWSYFVMAVVIAVSAAIGHCLGPRDAAERTTLAIESAARHPGLAMTIAALNFSSQAALAVLIPYLIVFTVVTTVYLQWRKRHLAERVRYS